MQSPPLPHPKPCSGLLALKPVGLCPMHEVLVLEKEGGAWAVMEVEGLLTRLPGVKFPEISGQTAGRASSHQERGLA